METLIIALPLLIILLFEVYHLSKENRRLQDRLIKEIMECKKYETLCRFKGIDTKED